MGCGRKGPYDAQAHLFDVSKLLIDPYATALDRSFTLASRFGRKRRRNFAHCAEMHRHCCRSRMRSDLPYRTPGFIYEVAVKAFTKLHPQIPESLRGTVAALAHPACIEHFLRLGVDTIELMPLMAWADERHLARQGLSNAWGYNPISFFAPDPRLAPGGLTGDTRNRCGAA